MPSSELTLSRWTSSGQTDVYAPIEYFLLHAEPGHELQADGAGAARDPAGQGATDEELLAAMDPRALWVQVQEAAGLGADPRPCFQNLIILIVILNLTNPSSCPSPSDNPRSCWAVT